MSADLFLSNHVDLEKEFNACVRRIFKDKEDIINLILKSERKCGVIDNIQREIKIAEWKVGFRLDSAGRREIVETVVRWFSELTIKKKEQDLKTEAQKALEWAKAEYHDRIAKEMDDEIAEDERNNKLIKVYQTK